MKLTINILIIPLSHLINKNITFFNDAFFYDKKLEFLLKWKKIT